MQRTVFEKEGMSEFVSYYAFIGVLEGSLRSATQIVDVLVVNHRYVSTIGSCQTGWRYVTQIRTRVAKRAPSNAQDSIASPTCSNEYIDVHGNDPTGITLLLLPSLDHSKHKHTHSTTDFAR